MSASPSQSEKDLRLTAGHHIWRTGGGVIFAACDDTSDFLRLLERLNAALIDNQFSHLKIDVEKDERNHLWVRLDGGSSLGDHLQT